MGKSSYREKRLAGQVSLALAAGMFSALPVAHGMPTLDPAAPHTGGTPDATAVIDANDPNKMNVTGSRTNNVVDWKDFSIAKGETVAFQNVGEQAANYMNIVTGHATSNIEGTMTNNGDIYLINPNGVIFGANAQVNVGNLYVSTREASQNMADTFRGTNADPVNDVGTILSAVTMTDALKSDVVNLIDQSGYVKADTVVMEGNNIRFLNTSSVGTKESTVTENADKYTVSAHPEATNIILRSDTDGYIHVGDTNDAANKYTAQTIKKDDQTDTYGTATGVNYKVVRDVAGLQAINSNLSGNYMLANDIDASTMTAPIGKASSLSTTVTESASNLPFKGKFDGMFFTVRNLNNTNEFSGLDAKSFVGLFAYAKNATIENIGVENTNLPYQKAGGLVGYADNTTIRNVWNIGRTSLTDTAKAVGKDTFNKSVGGLVGVLNNSSLTNAYNQGYISGGGLVGVIQGVTDSNKVVISNAYNIGKLVADTNNKLCGIAAQYVSGSSGVIKDVYTASLYRNDDYRNYIGDKTYQIETIVGTLNQGKLTDVYIVNKENTSIWEPIQGSYTQTKLTALTKGIGTSITAEQQITQDATSREAYTVKSNTWDISSEGGSNSAWRIYEGQSLPLLTAFFKGTVATDYSYNTIAADSTTETTASSDTYNPLSLPHKTYESAAVGPTGVKYYGMNAKETNFNDPNRDKSKDIFTNDEKFAGTFSLFYGGQQGYDLYGNNFTIDKRSIAFNASTNPEFKKIYDTNNDATDAVTAALKNATGGSTGFLDVDRPYTEGATPKISFNVTGITATYADQNAGTGKTVTVTVANNAAITLTNNLAKTDSNYETVSKICNSYAVTPESVQAMASSPTNQYTNGVITPRQVQVSLRKENGIDKTYDGTSDLVGTFTVNEGTTQNPNNQTYRYADQNLKVALDDTDLTAEELAAITTELGGSAELDTTALQAKYVNSSGVATKNVAETTGSTDHVAYTGIKLSGVSLTSNSNYAITDKDGNALAQTDAEDASKGYTLKASGAITKRNIDSADFGGGTTLRKTYDGTSAYTAPSGTQQQAVTVGDNAVEAEHATDIPQGKTAPEGLLVDDVDLVKFITAGTGTFLDKDGVETKNATNYKGANTGAQKAQYNVQLTNDSNAVAIQNYKLDGVDLAFKQADGVTTKTYGVEGAGIIDKRAIAIELVKNSDLDKTYNGTADLDAGTAANYKNGSISIGGGATGNLRYAQGSETIATTDTGVNISITNAAYADQNVAYDGSGNVTDKNITYTVAFNDTDAAYNYTLNTVASTTAPASTTLDATGEISPKELSLSFGSANKTYDGDALVDTIPTVTIDNLVTGDTLDEVFDSSKVAGRYGSDATGTFVTSANVGSYTSEAATAGAKVLYTGLKNDDGTYKDIKTAIKDTIKGKNYKISNTVYGKGIISKKTITTTDLDTATSVKNGYTPFTKVYDGSETDSSTAVTGLSWSDYLVWNDDQTVFAPTDRDNLTITIAEAIYTNKNVNDPESPQAVSLKYNIKGDAAANYEFEGTTVTSNLDGSQTIAYTKSGYTGTITPRTVTVTMKDGVTSPTKIYDGTTTVKADGVTTTAGVSTLDNGTWSNWFQLTNVVDGEDLQLANGITAAYASEDVAYDNTGAVTTQAVNYGNVALADGTSALASNYTLVNDIQGVGTINKRNVTLSDYGVATATKTYDGDADVEAYALTFAEATQEGATDKSVLFADGITTAAGVISSGLTGTYLKTGTETAGKDVLRDSTNRATILAKNVEYTGTALTKLYGGNYNVTLANGGSYNSTTGKLTVTGGGKISPKALQANGAEITAAAANKTYDGTSALTNDAISYLTFTNADLNTYKNDVLTVTGSYDNKNAGDSKTVTYTLTMKSGGAADNYDLSGDLVTAGTATKTGSGTISKKTIYGVVGATAAVQKDTVSKVYDGYTTVEDADATAAKALLTTNLAADGTGAVAITDEDGDLDDVSILTTGVTLAYKDANVATSDANDKVTYSGLALDGTDKDNYQLASTTIGGYGTITPKSIAFNITVDDGAYKKDYDGTTGLDGKVDGVAKTNSATLTAAVTEWWNSARATDDTTTFGNAFETDAGGNLVGYYGVWNPTTKTFTEKPDVWADKANNKKTSDVYYGLTLKGDAAQNYVITGGTTGATINVNNTTIQDTVYFQNAMQGKGEIKPLAISMEKVKNEWGTFEKVYDGSTSVEGYLVSGAATPTKEQQLTIYYDENDNGVRDKDANGNYTENVTITYSVTGANYEDANAGNGKNIAYTGFSFQTADLDNFVINATHLANKYKNGEAATKTTGNIARRLLVVSTDKESHEKIYDGSPALFDGSKTYNVARASATNKISGIVDADVNDKVSVTYVANFANADVNFNDTTKTVDNKPVTYTFTLTGASKDNYELTTVSPVAYPAAHTDETWTPAEDKLTKTVDGKIKQREVELTLNGTIDKTYDGNADADVSAQIGFANKDRDVIAENIKIGDVTAKYLANGTEVGETDAERAKNVAFNANGAVTTKTVSVQNVNFLNDDDSVNHNYVAKAGLNGSGKIEQKQVAAHLNNKDITKTYDGDSTVSDEFGIGNVVVASGVIDGDQLGLGLVEPAFYYEKDGSGNIPDNPRGYSDANETGGLGVKYLLKVDNKNYTLAKWRLDDEVNSAKITKRVLTPSGAETRIEKTYDGTTALGDASSVTTGLFSNVLDKDKATLLTVTGGSYSDPNTGAAADSVQGAAQQVTVNYKLTESGHKNYKLDNGDTTDTGTYNGNQGYINRAQLTLTPNNVTYSAGENIPADGYAGSVSGFQNNETLANDYSYAFRRDGNTSTSPGNYSLVGYVNGPNVSTDANGVMYYNNLVYNNDPTGNYYFVTAPNTALHVEAKADMVDVVERDTIADKKFTPDDYSYNRMSQDEDLTRINRESQAAVQYAEKGVNTDESSQGGLLASMDIQGAGSVVNLNGAVIQTSAAPEKPEAIAAEAALPIPETSEADFSSIDVENTDESGGSSSVLEILTKASNNAENRGTSIVINTMDEDEEDAEEEKSRRALIVDRSNIGIETLGEAVNLDQMIG